MEEEKDKKQTSRRKFLQIGGSVVVGAAIAGAAGRSLWKMVTDPGKLFYGGSTGQRTEQREP